MTFKTWLSDLTRIQGVVNNISKVDLFVNDSNLLNANTVKALSSSINGLNIQQAQLALSTKKLTTEQTRQVLVQAGLIASENKIQAELLQTTLAQTGLSKEKQNAILIDLGLMKADTLELLSTKSCTKAKLEDILATKGITGANAEAIISTLGLSTANTTATFSFELLAKSIWQSITALWTFLTTTPLGWFTMIAGGIGIVAGGISLFTTSMEEASKATVDAIDELSSITSEVETLESKITDLEAKINGLDPITDAEDIENLKAETRELENQLAILKEKERIASEDADKKAQESLGKTQGSRYQVETQQVTSGYAAANSDGTLEIATQVTREEELKNAMNAYDEYYKQRLELEAELAEMSADDEGYEEKLTAVETLNQQMTDARTHASELALALDEEKDGLNGTSEESKALLDSTNATLSSYSEWLDSINGVTNELNENANAIDNVIASSTKFTKSEMIDIINSMSDGFDALDKIYADIADKGTFDFKNLDSSKFEDQFSGLGKEYEKFIETVSSSPDDIDACQQAFNELTDAYIRQNDILDNLTEENAQLTIDMLENMGVVNAEEVVMSALGATFADYATAKRECALAGVDLTNATNEEIVALINENKVSRATAQGLFLYQAQKALANQNGINTVEDCIQLENLASAAGYTGSALLYVIKIKGLLNKIDSENLVEGTLGYEDVMGQVNTYNNALQKLLSTEKKSTISMSNYGGAVKSTSAANKNLKNSTDSANDALKRQQEQLEKTKEALEEEKAELEELHDAIMWFYDKQIEKIDDKIEVIKDENESYEDQIELIDDKIEALNKENEALDNQKENMDDVLSAIENNYDAEIKLIQNKIDALQDANDEEERALKLEEAKRKLQEAKSRKILQVYTKNAGFTYQIDTSAIKDAESELTELQENEVVEELQKQIELLEEARDRWSEIPDAYNKAMQEIEASKYFGSNWKNITLFPSDELLNNFEGKYSGIQSSVDANEDAIEKHEEEKERIQEIIELNEKAIEKHEKEKERIEELKQLWEDAKNAYKYAEYEKQLATFFGSDYEYQLLNNSASWREEYATKYGDICAQIEELEEKIKAASEQTGNTITQTGNAIAETGNKAETAARQIEDLNNQLDKINDKHTNSSHTHENITKNIIVSSGDTTSATSTSNTGRPGMTNLPSRYAKGTRNAKKGIAEVAEEGAEIITDGKNVFLAETPTLVNMQGGETVYDANETEQILASKGLKPLDESFLRNIETLKSTLQSENFTKNMHYSVPKFDLPKYDFSSLSMMNGGKQTTIEFKGDIVVQGVQDVEGFARAIKAKFPMVMQQELNKRF